MRLLLKEEGTNTSGISTYIQHQYVLPNALTNGVSLWAFNGIAPSISAQTPTGYATYMNLYRNYYVYKTKITMHVTNGSATTEMTLLQFKFPNTDATPTYGTSGAALDAREQPGLKSIVISPLGSGRNRGSVSGTYYTKKSIGYSSVYSPDWWGQVASPPTETYQVEHVLYNTGQWSSGGSATTLSYQWRVTVQYYLRFFQRYPFEADE